VKTSLLRDPTVTTLGRLPGKLIVPKEGPSFPAEDTIIIPASVALLI